jgi:hypothetical protein
MQISDFLAAMTPHAKANNGIDSSSQLLKSTAEIRR